MTDTIWSWPSGSPPRTRNFRLRTFNLSSVASQTQEYIPGGVLIQRWEVTLTLPVQTSEQWREIDGFLAALRGASGKVRLYDSVRKEPYYNQTVAGVTSPWSGGVHWDDGSDWNVGKLPPFVVNGETRSRGDSNTLMSGFPASVSGVLRRGDLIEFRPNGIPSEHGMMHIVTRWANSNSDGQSRVYFEPGLRRGLRSGDQIVIGGGGINPSSVFRLGSDDEGLIDVNEAHHGGLSVKLIEVLPHT